MKKIDISRGDFEKQGPGIKENSVSVTAAADITRPFSLELYSEPDGKRVSSIHFPKEYRMGSVYSIELKGLDPDSCLYRLKSGRKEYTDPYVRNIKGNRKFGKRDGLGRLDTPAPSLKNKRPLTEWEDMIAYLLNVRAFTKDSSSGTAHPGTFDALREKIPYLKDLGVTSLMLQPAYDFDEVTDLDHMSRLNLWGYVPGNYFVPKPSYAAGDPIEEFAALVDALHGNKMELIMQFYFMPDDAPGFILEVLRYWAKTYNVDGFEVMGADLPSKEIAKDPYLSDVKLFFTEFDPDYVYGRSAPPAKNIGIINDPFMYDMRKYLKGDEDMLHSVSKHILANPDRTAVINHITSYYGFTLKDLVSYERKHNEKNGEGGSDGSDYNYSWNCGDEGTSRKKAVNTLRLRQMKNAAMLLLLSQGVPMIRYGDEFGNSQKGNNNAWCQDNKISYLDWKDLEKNKELFDFTKELISLRREHPVFHSRYSKKMYDYISCGSPDVSFHGDQAWNQSFVNYNRHFAMMYTGAYEKISDKSVDDDFYVAYNMHWTGHRFHPPKPSKGKKWEICVSSGNGREAGIFDPEKNELAVYARSIVVLRAK
ncbi:MAG: alpha-amylase [Lachnospiraceae bacterium]|nr:alpha-amylase [Lachnospiraceae bacterium]